MSFLKNNKQGNVQIVIMAVVAAIVIAISLIIVFSVVGSLDTSTIDADFGLASETPAANATDHLLANLNTFYTISPVYIVVLAAVGIISAVMMIMIKR